MSQTPLGKIDVKVSSRDTKGGLLVVEMTHHVNGGPGLHLHHEQDEWFHVIAGEYIFEIGGQRSLLKAGDSCFGPRRIPHAWSFVGTQVGRIVFVFAPAGRMETFFQKIREAGVIPRNDTALFQDHGMELIGPPL